MVGTVLFPKRLWEGIAAGSVTAAYRRWERPRVLTGRRYRTPGGIIEVESVDLVAPDEIDDRDADLGGYHSAVELVAELRGDLRSPLWRVRFHKVNEPDPRQVLSETADLTESDVDKIEQRLARLDMASPDGAWTESALASIAESPAVRAGDLAASLGVERGVFKRNVRKLKELGLTWSLERGYRLSPRGEAYLTAKRGSEPA
jgi:hypothetical protein